MEYIEKAVSAAGSVAAAMPEGTRTVVGCTAAGLAAVPLVATGAGLLVPTAMSYFGTVVSGVGTIHAAGGVAATLQYTAATYATTSAAAMGGAAGAAVGATVETAKRLFGN
ncbi:hypothetical protein P43SY_012073 [Pythium insidiosum]|uniref:Uncharacterized protein n=1 Tax=Pythium insidiosum TaxID=114742 RepID=A0AAD5L733_PYTIN|nr:hypothetical protein P43SY_012073 [Pythium insidiosum]KAJ0391248.1 hypothetical protein ATCC90586_012206 [Pythium insidiosum]